MKEDMKPDNTIKDIFWVLDTVKKNNAIDELSFHSYPAQTLIQDETILTSSEKLQLNSALEMRDKYKIPFWDCMMLTYFGNEKASLKFLKLAQRHNKKDIFFVNDIFAFRDEIEYQNTKYSVNSKIIKNGEAYHVPLIDFHIYQSGTNLKVVKDILCEMKINGYILSSGESYHFVSKSICNESYLLDFLAKMLLFAPIVDKSWIAHQMLERSCSLRVTKKHNLVPFVVAEI